MTTTMAPPANCYNGVGKLMEFPMISQLSIVRMSTFRALPFVLFAAVAGCSTVGTVTNYRRDTFRLAGIAWSNPSELRLWFCDNVAFFWALDTERSYFLRNGEEKLRIVSRPGLNENGSRQGVYLYISRADKKPFEAGVYETSLVLNAQYPEYPRYKRQETVTGGFALDLKHGAFLTAPKLEP